MEKLMTPFGDIDIQIDGQSVDYEAKEGRKLSQWCPNVIGRYQIRITFVPDGFFNHTICCSFNPSCKFKSEIESGELFESMGFYNNQRYKMSIDLLAKVKAKIAELDHWTDKQETKAAVDNLIRDTLWEELPDSYDDAHIPGYKDKIYEYIYLRYGINKAA